MAKDLFDLASEISADDIVDESVKLLPHNQKLYDDILAQMSNGEHSIFYSEGTGLGKSFIFMKLVHDYFKDARVLYIVPKNAIWNNVCHYKEFAYIADRVTLATFTTFNRYPNNNISCADYDVVFVDECHHMLSDVQGKNVKKFLDDMVSWDKHVFGMTATPEIEGVFVDEKCFDVSCYGLDMFEAIEQELMPKMDIAIGIKEDIDIPDNLREQYSVVGTKTLLETVIDDYKHVTHWLAYFTTTKELEQNESELRKLFPEFKILKAYHGLDNTEEVITEFENSRQPVILMTVSMFLEGMHLDNVGGVLLYRNVQKGHTYAQILGRLCVIGQKQAPVMVDITGSVISIKQFYMPKSNRVPESKRKMYERKDVFDVTSRGYRLVELMEEVRSRVSSYFWTEEEDNIIREYFPTEGIKVKDRLPGRTESGIYQRAQRLGVPHETTWLEEEVEYLKENAKELSIEEIACFITRHNKLSIWAMLNKLGLEYIKGYKEYTEEEDAIIKEWFPLEGKACYKRLDGSRTATSVANRAFALEVRYDPELKWDNEVCNKVRQLYKEGYSYERISKEVGISKGRASYILDKFGEKRGTSRRFSATENACIEECVSKGLSYSETLDEVNKLPENIDCPRTAATLRGYVRTKFGSQSKMNEWTEGEIVALCLNATKYSVKELSEKILPNKSADQIYQKLRQYNVEYKKVR